MVFSLLHIVPEEAVRHPELSFPLCEAGDVPALRDEQVHLAAVVGHRSDREVDDRVAVGALDGDPVPEELPAACGCDGLPGDLAGRLLGLEPVGVPQLLTDQLRGGAAGELRGRLVDLQQRPVGRHQPRELVGVVEDGLEAPPAGPPVGDVPPDAGHPPELAVGVSQRAAGELEGDPLAVGRLEGRLHGHRPAVLEDGLEAVGDPLDLVVRHEVGDVHLLELAGVVPGLGLEPIVPPEEVPRGVEGVQYVRQRVEDAFDGPLFLLEAALASPLLRNVAGGAGEPLDRAVPTGDRLGLHEDVPLEPLVGVDPELDRLRLPVGEPRHRRGGALSVLRVDRLEKRPRLRAEPPFGLAEQLGVRGVDEQ